MNNNQWPSWKRGASKVTVAAMALTMAFSPFAPTLTAYANETAPVVQEIGEPVLVSEADLTYSTTTGGNVYIKGYSGTEKNIIIPDTIDGNPVTRIDRYAFQSKGLVGVQIPSTVTYIADYAFMNNQLTSVSIPEGVSTIGRQAFQNNQLTEVHIPANVYTMDYAAFANNSLETVSFADGTRLRTIGNSVFYKNKLKDVTIPSGVTNIDYAAFSENELENVSFPSTVTNLGNNAFDGNKLTKVTLPENLTTFGYGVFSNNLIEEVVFPENPKFTEIGKDMFVNNKLQHLDVPEGMTSVGGFKGNELKSITLPASLKTVESNAFEGNMLSDVVVPESVTTIGKAAFKDNVLTSFTLPSGVTAIEEETFAGNNLIDLSVPGHIQSVGLRAFADNDLTSVELQSGTKTIGDMSFVGNQIEELVLQEGLETIGTMSFYDNNISRLELPSSVTVVGDKAFMLNQLTNVKVNGADTTFGFYSMRMNQLNSHALTIHGSEGSQAQQHATDNGYTFTTDMSDLPVHPDAGAVMKGEGTPADPYLIDSRETLEMMGTPAYQGGHFKITQNIDLAGQNWQPIEFEGVLEGGNHTISGLTIGNITNAEGYGLIGNVDSGEQVEIRNLNLDNVNINVDDYRSPLTTAGGLIGTVDMQNVGNFKVDNVSVQGAITQTQDSTGGLIGELNVNTSLDYTERELWKDAAFTNITTDVDLLGNTTGGVIGATTGVDVSLNDLTIQGTVKGNNSSGGLIGDADYAFVKVDDAEIDVNMTDERIGRNSFGGVVGYLDGHFAADNVNVKGQIGSAEAPAYSGGGFVGEIYTDPYDGVSVSTVTDSTFEGQVHGEYYAGGVYGQAYGGTDYYKGPHEYQNSFLVKNTGVKGQLYSEDSAGGIVAYSESMDIYRSHFEGDIVSEYGWGVGGLIGQGYSEDRIRESWATGTVQGYEAVGGLIGYADQYGNRVDSQRVYYLPDDFKTVENSYAQMDVNGSEQVGGILGASGYGVDIVNAYHSGALKGESQVGGMVGYSEEDPYIVKAGGGTKFNFKSVFSLPAHVDMTDPTAYQSLTNAINRDTDLPDYSQVSSTDFYVISKPTPVGDQTMTDGTISVPESMQRVTYESKGWDFNRVWGIDEGETLPYLLPQTPETPDPVDPEDPTDPTDPTNPIEPEPTDPTDPDNGTDPGNGEVDPGDENGGETDPTEPGDGSGGDNGEVEPGDGSGGGGGLEACPDVRSIAVYVHVAELSKRDPHITNAIDKVSQLPECKEKEEFEQRIHAIFEWLEQYEYEIFLESVEKNLDWASKYEREPYFTAVQDKVGGVKDEAKQEEIQSELDSIYEGMSERQKAAALKNATTLVGFAERYEREPYLSRAEAALEATPPSDEKTALEERFNAVMEKLGQAVEERKLADATEAVEKAETARSIFAIEDAQALVDELKDGADKDALTDRLASIEITEEMLAVYELKLTIAGIEDADAKSLFEKAYGSIETAEQKGSRYTAAADEAMTALEQYGAEDAEDEVLKGLVTTLTDYLDRVKHGQAVQAAVTTAENAIKSAERYSRDMYVTRADDALTALKELDPEYDTAELDSRLQVVKDKLEDAAQAANIANAEKQIGYAERYKRDPYLSRAQAAIDLLQDGDTKSALQERLDAVTK